MTLDPPWNGFDLPEAAEVTPAGQGLALTYPGRRAGPFDRAFTDAGWERVTRERGALQTTTTWEREGWRLSVNMTPLRRTDTLDVRVLIVGIPESERWTELHLPLGPGVIVRDNGRELGVMFDDASPATVAADAIDRLVADGWTEAQTRSARTLMNKPDAPTLTVWAEPAGEDALLHLSWGGPATLAAEPQAATAPVDRPADAVPLTEPWRSMNLPFNAGVVLYSDRVTATATYDHGGRDEWFHAFELAIVAQGWTRTFISTEGDMLITMYEHDNVTVSIAALEVRGTVTVSLTQL